MMDKDYSLAELMEGISHRMRIDFEEITKAIPATLERGEAREKVLRRFLENYLPRRFGVSSGFVIDALGNVSRQIDVIVYDRVNAPVFNIIEDKMVFPVECVCAVGEVKSGLDKQELRDAIEKIASVKRLDRTNRGKNERRHGAGYVGEHLRRDYYNDQVFGVIFAYDSIDLETIASHLLTANTAIDREYWCNVLCVLDKGIVSYVAEDQLLRPEPLRAVGIYSTDAGEGHDALLTFYSILWSFLSASHSGTVEIFDYLSTRTQKSPVRVLRISKT